MNTPESIATHRQRDEAVCYYTPVRVQPCFVSVSRAGEVLTDASPSLCLCQHLHRYSPGIAPEDVLLSHEKRNKDRDSWLYASDHLCQCHHCICHRGLKPPRQATQWGAAAAAVKGVGNKL